MPDETSTGEAMSEERLAEIRHDSRNDRWEFSYDAGDAVRDLLAEVERLRGVEAQRDAYWATLERYDGQLWDGLLAERDAAVERAQTAEREVERLRADRDALQPARDRVNQMRNRLDQQNAETIEALQTEAAEQRTRAEVAERELAEMRERVGEEREEWGVRTYDDDTEVMRTREQAENLAAAWRTEIPNSNPTVRVRTQCAPGPWRDVDGGEWKAADGG